MSSILEMLNLNFLDQIGSQLHEFGVPERGLNWKCSWTEKDQGLSPEASSVKSVRWRERTSKVDWVPGEWGECGAWQPSEEDRSRGCNVFYPIRAFLSHSSVLAWRIPGTGEPGGLPSLGSRSWTRLKRLSSSSSSRAFLIAHSVKNLPAVQETLIRFLDLEDPPEKGQATHSSILGLHLWLSW